MSTKLYVGSLPYSVRDQELEGFFATKGNVVSAKVIMDMATGRSKGFGFVEMSSEDEAQRAIQQLNGTDFQGRSVVVSLARPQTAGNGGGRGRSGGGGRSSSGGFGGGNKRGGSDRGDRGSRW